MLNLYQPLWGNKMNSLFKFITVLGITFVAMLTMAMDEAEHQRIQSEKYGIQFYGIQIPEEGARVVLILDTSGSMSCLVRSADGKPKRRWDILIEEVEQMLKSMAEQSAKTGAPFALGVIFEGTSGGDPTPFYTIEASRYNTLPLPQLIKRLNAIDPSGGATFDEVFSNKLWPYVAKHGATHAIFLGDDDIQYMADAVIQSVKKWYQTTSQGSAAKFSFGKKNFKGPLSALKNKWAAAPWSRAMPTAPHKQKSGLKFSNKSAKQKFPPRPQDVTFHCIAINVDSETLKTIAKLGGGEYTLNED